MSDVNITQRGRINMKLASIEGGRKSEQTSEIKDALRMMLDNFKDLLEYQRIRAELKRAYYEGLITQGFTKEEALKLTAEDTTFN